MAIFEFLKDFRMSNMHLNHNANSWLENAMVDFLLHIEVNELIDTETASDNHFKYASDLLWNTHNNKKPVATSVLNNYVYAYTWANLLLWPSQEIG